MSDSFWTWNCFQIDAYQISDKSDQRKFETTFEIRPNEKLKLIFFVSVNPLYAEGSNTKQFPIIPRSNCHSFLQSILFKRQTRIILFSLKQGSSTMFVNEFLGETVSTSWWQKRLFQTCHPHFPATIYHMLHMSSTSISSICSILYAWNWSYIYWTCSFKHFVKINRIQIHPFWVCFQLFFYCMYFLHAL